MANAAIEDYNTMIQGLTKYMNELEENCSTLNKAVQLYDEGVNDRTSQVYRMKVEKLCQQINPNILDRVDKLRTNLLQQVEKLEEMEIQLQQEMNELEEY